MTLDDEDTLNDVIRQLTVITNLFDFYATIEMHNLLTGFRKQTLEGLIVIIDGCIDKLDAIKEQSEQLRR
jgi:hypothetical protein